MIYKRVARLHIKTNHQFAKIVEYLDRYRAGVEISSQL